MANKHYKYVVFSPYFGKLPVYFDLWLKSCSYNKDFHFVVFTDDSNEYHIPDNVELIHMSFDAFRDKIQSKFNFHIALEKPYKLCDFKAAYGYIFSDYIKGCNYWGYCDLDLIFGNIEAFLPDDDYDKISHLGSFCLYKNTRIINEAFMLCKKGTISYNDVLSSNCNFAFDEVGNYGINSILLRNGFKIYNFESSMADIISTRKGLFLARHNNEIVVRDRDEKAFLFSHGKVSSISLTGNSSDEEYSYIHFQKRKMSNNVKNSEEFVLKYDGFIDSRYKDDVEKLAAPQAFINWYWVKVKLTTVPRRIKRALVASCIINRARREQ